MTGWRAYASTVLGVAWRSLHNAFTTPALLFPSLIFPLSSSPRSAAASRPSARPRASTTPRGTRPSSSGFVLLQSSALGGVFTGFSVAADFQFGMGRRMLLATRHRTAIICGYAITAIVRVLVTWTVVTSVALLAGMSIGGNPAEVLALYVLSLSINVVALLFASGVALRLRTLQAGPLMQFPMFILLFLTPVYVPQALLAGWIAHVAKVNPLTLVLNTNRDLLAGLSAQIALTYVVVLCLIALLSTWAVSGMRRAEAAG